MRCRSRVSLFWLSLGVTLALVGCRSVSAPVSQELQATRTTDQALLDGMNPFLLSSLIDSDLLIEIDWVEGGKPSAEVLAFFEEAVRGVCAEGKAVRVWPDDEIPRAEVEALEGLRGLETLVGRYLDSDPTRWREEELVYVLYLPESAPFYGTEVVGIQDRVRFQRDEAVRSVPLMVLFFESLRDKAQLWIGPEKIERAMLVHELGHVLGLVSNPEHAQKKHPHHCSVDRCVLNRPHLGSTLRNSIPALFAGKIPSDYCRRCREDVQRVRRLWRELASKDPAFVERLRTERAERERREAGRWLLQRAIE